MRTRTSNIASVVGHDKNESGYYSKPLGMSEYMYNSELATHLDCTDVYNRPQAKGYITQMNLLAEKLNPMGYDMVAELHFNGFDNLANNKGVGVEVVIYKGNKEMREFGEKYCETISKAYGIPNRGVKERSEGRGVEFLKKMEANAIILEPFFGDELEAEKFKDIKKHGEILNNLFLEYLER